ncbi:site-specific integrase [Bordetella petrii]|uniref:Shufflon-specific DNA recombinase n=1 Tax=Bordetella petrii (strain ATCC BAA-461 / DSM 12804 / CCUG 43448 / CIP 107267 / Se-1111R) TaxID=340100 RepID=A9ID95_BORPD|nr:site-specific integrase [Bordetella petrii]CAP44783.1 shufflon-specific DNA recombinase [Bordetella petrii]
MPTALRRRRLPPTLAAALKRYLVEVSAAKKGAVSERSIAKAWQATRLANRPVDRITNTDIIEVRDAWLADRASGTVVRRLAFLSHVYTVLRKDWGWRSLANPVQLVRRPSVNDSRDRRLFDQIRLRGVPCPKDELAWIIQATKSLELPTILTMAVETGMRRSEIIQIRRENLDLQHGLVYLPDTKNGHARTVPLTPVAKETLRRWVVGKPLRGRIFTMRAGSVTRAFIRARLRARKRYEALCRFHGRRPNTAYFADLRLHDLRHEAISRLASVFQIHDLAKVAGHRDTRMLLRYYHPDGRYLVHQITRSQLGRRQLEQLREERQLLVA